MNNITVSVPLETVNAALQALTKMPFEFAFRHIQLLEQLGNAAINAANAANAQPQAPAPAPAPQPMGEKQA